MHYPKPKTSPLNKIALKDPSLFKLPNGLTVIYLQQTKLPLVCFNLCLDIRPFNHALFPGYNQVIDALMGRGNKMLSQTDFYNQVDFLGAQLEFSLTNSLINGLSTYKDTLCKLFSQAILQPHFLESELDKVKTQLIHELNLSKKDPEFIAKRSQKALTYGLNHPQGVFTTAENLSAIKLNTVKNLYLNYIKPNNAYLIIHGDMSLEETKVLAHKHWLNWPCSKVNFSPEKLYSICKKNTLSCIPIKDAPQNIIAITKALEIPLNHPQHFDLLLANELLGGGADGYLFQVLREEKGFTYSAYSQLPRHKAMPVLFKAISYSRPEVTEEALNLMFQQLHRLCTQTVSKTQLTVVKEKLIGRFIRCLESSQHLIQCAYNLQTQNLHKSFYKNYIHSIQSVSEQSILHAAQNHLSPKTMKAIIVGNTNSLFENQDSLSLSNVTFSKQVITHDLNPLS